MPTISVIMNCYNSATHLREALNSVLSQTFSNWEIVFWDNASTDESPAIIDAYAATDARIRVFHATSNTPLGEARNLALAQAQGAYAAFLDCDDLWEPQKLAAQLALFEANPRVGLVCTDTVIFSEKGELSRMFAKSPAARGSVFSQLIATQWISMSSAMLRMEALRSLHHWFDPTLSLCEEADVFYRLAKTWELDFVPAPLTRWRVHGVNTTFRKFDQFAAETRAILQKFITLYPDFTATHPDIVMLLEQRADFQQAVALWKNGNGAAARHVLAGKINTSKRKLFWLASWLPGSVFMYLSQLYFALPAAWRR